MSADLKRSEIENVEFIFDILKDVAANKVDCENLGMILRAVGLNPSLDALEKLGETKKPGQKHITLDELLAIYAESKKEIKDQGCYEDFVECLKLYDKNENGKMLAAELSHSLLCLGEKLTEDQVDTLFTDCLPEEDDEGEIEYDNSGGNNYVPLRNPAMRSFNNPNSLSEFEEGGASPGNMQFHQDLSLSLTYWRTHRRQKMADKIIFS